MSNKLPTITTIVCFVLLLLAFPVARAYAAPYLRFDKTTQSIAQNSTFTLTVNINVDAYSAQSSKATVKYASGDLEVMQVAKGAFFPEFAWANDTGSGQLELTGYTTSPGSGYSANGQLATITFKAKRGSGSGTITFGCDGGFHDSNILTLQGTNILDCGSVNQTAVTYLTSGSTPTPTPTPGNPTPTPTPQQGTNTVPVCANLTADKTTAVGTPLTVSFTCSGVDTDGYIKAAYFDFGDGTTQTIEKNVGSPGAIGTTHSYTTVGTLGASCRVQDNNNVWSQTPEVCRKTITIKPRPRVIVVQPTVNPNVLPTPTPTPPEISLIIITPTATPSPELTPEPSLLLEEQPDEGSGPNYLLIGSIAVIVIGGIIYLLSKRPHQPQIPTQPPTTTPPAATQ